MSDGSDSYRYGFNGKENDFEIKNGQGTSTDFGARMYDPRLGKFFSLDPLANKYAGEAPYSYVGDSPLLFIDKEGKTKIVYTTTIDKDGKKTTVCTVDKKVVQKINFGAQFTASGYHNQYEVEYDIAVFVTIDYSKTTDGKPKISTSVKLYERSVTDDIKDEFIKVKNALWKFEDWIGTEPDGNAHLDDLKGDKEHGKFGQRDPTDGMFPPDMSGASSDKDKDGFNIYEDGRAGKPFVEGNIWKDKNGDTSSFMERDGTKEIQTYDDKDGKKKESLKKWTPLPEVKK